jgi:hypothetical protein
MMGLAELDTARIEWRDLSEAAGTTAAYWRLENHLVVQGSVFEAAEPSVSVLVAALADERPRHVRVSILDLLFQILNGGPDHSEVALLVGSYPSRCGQRLLR